MDLQSVKKVYILGIGGIGVSALARMFLSHGKQVLGSDTFSSLITEELSKLGADIYIGQDSNHIPSDVDMVIYTIAIPHFAPEFFKEIKERFKNVVSYPEALGQLSKEHYTIAISGTHGKTTTTGMVAEMMIAANLDPLVIVGSLLSKYKSNFIDGKSNYFVVEACEYQNSFLNLEPRVAIITNIDNDHLDFFENEDAVVASFREFANRVAADGFIICDASDTKVKTAIASAKATIIDYNPFIDSSLRLLVSGEHNRRNAACALALAHVLGLNQAVATDALSQFSGTWRRFEYKGKTKEGADIYDDYGHHPTEIKATIQGAREKNPSGKLFVIFEPHLFSRTKLLLNEFSECFKGADEVIVTPIYPAREAFDSEISSELLVGKITNTKAQYEDSFQSAADYVTQRAKEGDIILITGAGNITNITELLRA